MWLYVFVSILKNIEGRFCFIKMFHSFKFKETNKSLNEILFNANLVNLGKIKPIIFNYRLYKIFIIMCISK